MQSGKSKICYSPEAIRDLDEIWAYLLDELQNSDAAVSTVDGIVERIDQLRGFPQMGPALSSITEMESDYRFLVCGGYLAIYHVGDAAVFVDRILYARRDYLRVLLGDAAETDL